MIDIFKIIEEAKCLISEGDRGQILLPTANKPKSDNKGQSFGENPDPKNVIGKGEAEAKKVIKSKKKKVTESRLEKAKGSKEGRKSIQDYSKKSHTNPVKSKVTVYKSIDDALHNARMGQIFSTKNADRLYVVTKRKWGKSDQQNVSGRTAKGFSPGSIPASFKDVKKYSVRTMVRHAGGSKKSNKNLLPGAKKKS